MTITSNSIGNYNPYKLKIVESKENNLKLSAEPISKEEKDFFAGLYPENKKEITDYHFYHRNGKMSGVSIGSNIDRRG